VADVVATLNYVAEMSTKPSYRIGAVSDPIEARITYVAVETVIHDGRHVAGGFSLDDAGLVCRQVPCSFARFDSEELVTTVYYDHVKTLVFELTGAQEVCILDHTIRSSAKTSNIREIVTHVHCDYTEASCLAHARRVTGDATVNERYRILQLNVWRPFKGTVFSAPLAVADASTIRFEDLVACDLIYPDRIGEIYEVRPHEAQLWYYFPYMTPDEVLVFKGYDSSRGVRGRCTPHSAFVHPDQAPGAPPRHSIEVRVLALLPPA
jgi:hypothetical protein